MRRLTAIFGALVLLTAAVPSRADANFWKWIDDLSGPRFQGVQLDWRVWCRSQDLKTVLPGLRTRMSVIVTAADRNEAARTNNTNANAAFASARDAARQAATLADQASSAGQNPLNDVGEIVWEALQWGHDAERHYQRALIYASNDTPSDSPPTPRTQRTVTPKSLLSFGLSASVCDVKPLTRNTAFATVNFAWGWDTKDAARDDRNRMVSFGASIHGVTTPYLTVGAGAGVAWFSSGSIDGFRKFYVQPYIIDVRPLAIVKRDSEYLGPWWHVVYFRYSTVMFPAGFEAGRFPGSPRYGPELVHSLGIHADLEPLMRKLGGKW
jgi:hypothetical protein